MQSSISSWHFTSVANCIYFRSGQRVVIMQRFNNWGTCTLRVLCLCAQTCSAFIVTVFHWGLLQRISLNISYPYPGKGKLNQFSHLLPVKPLLCCSVSSLLPHFHSFNTPLPPSFCKLQALGDKTSFLHLNERALG